MSRWKKEDFKYKIGDIVSGGIIKGYTCVPDGKSKKGVVYYKKGYLIMCDTYDSIYKQRESDTIRGFSSPYKRGLKTCKNNTIKVLRPDLTPFIKNEGDAEKTCIHSGENIEWRCLNCDLEFFKKPSYINKHGFKCPNCGIKKSYAEILMSKLLQVEFKEQKTFKNCFYKKKLPFDFYIPSLNVCIEMQGIQHYKPVEVFGGELGFKETKIRDEIKRNFCKDNNIELILIDSSKSDFNFILNNINNTKLKKYIKTSNLDLSYHDKKYKDIIYMFKKGLTYKEIYTSLETTYHHVVTVLKKEGLYEAKKRGGHNRKTVKCINTGEIFYDAQEASNWCNVFYTNIRSCINGYQKSAGKHPITGEKLYWEYVDNE